MKCEKLLTCPFYNDKMDINKGLGKIYKEQFCEGNKEKCARYKVATTLGKDFVPSNLYPNMDKRADEIIAENRK